MYNGKAFVFSISQWLNGEGATKNKNTIHGNYLLGDSLIYTRTNFTYGTDGETYKINKFSSKVVQQSCYYSADSAYYTARAYAYIFKI